MIEAAVHPNELDSLGAWIHQTQANAFLAFAVFGKDIVGADIRHRQPPRFSLSIGAPLRKNPACLGSTRRPVVRGSARFRRHRS
jgi:hypothetical protein